MKSKKYKDKKTKKRDKFTEDDLLFSSDEHFAFIAGFTSNGVPYGITHEEMKLMENNSNSSDEKEDNELPF